MRLFTTVGLVLIAALLAVGCGSSKKKTSSTSTTSTTSSSTSATKAAKLAAKTDACVEACPVDAIFPEALTPDKFEYALELNAEFFVERSTAERTAIP